MLKKWILLTLCLLLPVVCLAEAEAPADDGTRIEDFGDFTLPVAENAIVERYDKEADADGYVAVITYVDLSCEAFFPHMVITWYYQNLTAYYERLHPLDYAKALWANTLAGWEEEGIVVSGEKTVYGQKKGKTFTGLHYCFMEENSFLASKPHDLWIAERYYGTYDMGTYTFDLWAESREEIDAMLKVLDQIVYKQ